MRVPRPTSGRDIRSLPLSPTEAFLLSRIDATMNERDLAALTGLSPAEVATALNRLHQLGAIDFIQPATPIGSIAARSEPGQPPQAGARPSNRPGPMETPRPPGTGPMRPIGEPTPPLYDPSELDEDVEIEPEKKRRILDLYYRLEDLSYYEILGVDEQAEKKKIKSAYYALAPEFHPDKYFRKNLGTYKTKIEAVFTRVTLAHDVLTMKDRREEYDEYLALTKKNRAMSAILEQTPRDVASIAAAVDESVAAVTGAYASPGRYSSEPARVSSIPPAPRPASIPPVSSPSTPPLSSPSALPLSSPGSPSTPAPRPAGHDDAAERLRRATLARKLSGTRRAATLPPAPAPAHDPAIQARAAEALRQRHDAAQAEAKRQQLQRYLDMGKGALDKQDFASAANAYRIAASLAPDDAKVQATCAEAMHLADIALADGYWKQARYEEEQGRWAEAALSYAKVCNGRPTDGRSHERVAALTLRSSANVRRAVEFARKAVEIDPKSAEFRVTLAGTYFAAGLEKSALGEIERALELAPNDAKIKDLIRVAREQAQKPGN
jgi:curved DNA-binding protein CbpA/cytochrome c-type biogenesis protein CcmH/NrfG